MSASFAKKTSRDLDPPVSKDPKSPSNPARLRKRTITSALAVVGAAGVLAAPVHAAQDTPVEAAIVGDVTPVTYDASLVRGRDVPVVVVAAGTFDQDQQVTSVAADEPSPEPSAAVVSAPARTVWDRLADCESGDWDANGTPIPGSARWDYGLTFSHGDFFEGGPNFHPRTWESFKDANMPGHAGQATRAQQIVVAERVLAAQGWGAWPVCSRKLGLR